MQFITKQGHTSTVYNYKSLLDSDDYLQWKASATCERIKKVVYDAYIDHSLSSSVINDFVTFDAKYHSAGFSIHKLPLGCSILDLEYFQIYIFERLATLRYIVQMSEVKNGSSTNTTKIIYQKPSARLELINGKCNQLFGNVFLELQHDCERLIFFKMIVHRYNDYKYDTGSPFDELIAYLFND